MRPSRGGREVLALALLCAMRLAPAGCTRLAGRSSSPRPLVSARSSVPAPPPVPAIPFAPRTYVCAKAVSPLSIDGRLDEGPWALAPWTERFVDIAGQSQAVPRLTTRVKMLWDDRCFYVGAELEEPHVWATLEARDSVIFHDNDFEVFLDPDGDTHMYGELEINALGTVWDLLLVKPYRDGGPAVDAWDMPGLEAAVHVDGTINRPGDTDRGWSVEIAIPWSALKACTGTDKPPGDGDQWRVNFSRVQWRLEIRAGRYVKALDQATGRPLPEDNWVWSPQGIVNMHYPEMWGFVQFSHQPAGRGDVSFRRRPEEDAKWALRNVYYAERAYVAAHGAYARNPSALGIDPSFRRGPYRWPPVIHATPAFFQSCLDPTTAGPTLCIAQDGRVWTR